MKLIIADKVNSDDTRKSLRDNFRKKYKDWFELIRPLPEARIDLDDFRLDLLKKIAGGI